MALADVAHALLDLRDDLPALIGEAWPTVKDELTAQTDRLKRARTPEERQAAIDALISALIRFETVQPHVRRALRAGSTTRGGRRAAGRHERHVSRTRRPADEQPPVLERWPHIDVDRPQPVPAGSELCVMVYVDARGPQERRDGQAARAPRTPRDPPSRGARDVASFRGRGSGERVDHRHPGRGALHYGGVPAARRPERLLRFSGVITAFLAYDGRPAGSVHRQVAVGEAAAAAGAEELPAPALSADLRAERPDLTVEIRPDPGLGRAALLLHGLDRAPPRVRGRDDDDVGPP
jgi:hypothetical protein